MPEGGRKKPMVSSIHYFLSYCSGVTFYFGEGGDMYTLWTSESVYIGRGMQYRKIKGIIASSGQENICNGYRKPGHIYTLPHLTHACVPFFNLSEPPTSLHSRFLSNLFDHVIFLQTEERMVMNRNHKARSYNDPRRNRLSESRPAQSCAYSAYSPAEPNDAENKYQTDQCGYAHDSIQDVKGSIYVQLH